MSARGRGEGCKILTGKSVPNGSSLSLTHAQTGVLECGTVPSGAEQVHYTTITSPAQLGKQEGERKYVNQKIIRGKGDSSSLK